MELRVQDAKAAIRKLFLVAGGVGAVREAHYTRELVAVSPEEYRSLCSWNPDYNVRFYCSVCEVPRSSSGVDANMLEAAVEVFASNPRVERILGRAKLDQAFDAFIEDLFDADLAASSSARQLVEKVFDVDELDEAIDMFLEGLHPSSVISLASDEEAYGLLKEIHGG